MLLPRLDLAVALGVGVGGALVDVSSYARLTDGLSRRWGRDDAFYGVEPGTFSFVLDNADGRFTPENASSPLATTLTEGMSACVSVGGRLTAGVVRSVEPEFPGGDAGWARVRVTCEDALGDPSRVRLVSPTVSAALAQSPGGVWPLSDPAGSPFLSEVSGFGNPIFVAGAMTTTYGVAGTAPGGGEQITVSTGAGSLGFLAPAQVPGGFNVDQFGDSTCVGVWVTPRNLTSKLEIAAVLSVGVGGVQVYFGVEGDRFYIYTFAGPTTTYSEPFIVGEAYHLTVVYAGSDIEFRVDGVLVHSYTEIGVAQPAAVNITVGGASVTEVSLAELTFTDTRIQGEGFKQTTTGERLESLAQAGTITLGTLPAGLSPAVLVEADTDGSSLLDAFNDVVLTEQGDLYTVTTGTLTAPTTTVVVRERTRPETVSYTFDVEDELSGAPSFVRDITNLVSRVVVSSSSGDTTVSDTDLTSRAGQAGTTESVLLADSTDRRAWGEDRLIRGANTKMRIASVVVDAMTTPTDRSADMLALIPGDRVQFTGLPSTVLGFDTWDGWFLGASETHTIESHSFQLHFTPVLPDTAIYDTDRYMADGELSLNGAINSSVTSISVESTGALLDATDVPYVIQFDDEQLTVTAVTGASSPQTVTVTRGANGTTAAAHSDGAVLVGPVPDSLYAF